MSTVTIAASAGTARGTDQKTNRSPGHEESGSPTDVLRLDAALAKALEGRNATIAILQ
jgi:hypothetical protein